MYFIESAIKEFFILCKSPFDNISISLEHAFTLLKFIVINSPSFLLFPQILNFKNPSIFSKVLDVLSFKKFPKIKVFFNSCYPLTYSESQGLYLIRKSWMKKTLSKVNTYTEYRVFTELKHLNLCGCNAYPKSNNEIAPVEAIVYERVKSNSKKIMFGGVCLFVPVWDVRCQNQIWDFNRFTIKSCKIFVFNCFHGWMDGWICTVSIFL